MANVLKKRQAAMDSSSVSQASVLRFGVFELDCHAGELRKSGVLIHLPPQPFNVLALLATRSGQVVTREYIRQEIWGDETFVDFERGLNQCVRQVRAALGDDAETPRFIETLPRRGYRFIYPVTVPSAAAGSPGGSVPPGVVDGIPAASAHQGEDKAFPYQFTALAAAVVMVIVVAAVGLNVAGLRNRMLRSVQSVREKRHPIHSIAVLPLANLSADPQQEYFAEGMTDELITELSKIAALRVIARTSAMRYKATKKPLPEIAKELNVDAAVEGSVLRSGNRVRINVQLVDASTQRNLWAQTYDRKLGDILALHSEVARAIAREIQITIAPDERTRLASTREVNPNAYEAYLRGLYLFNKRTEEDIRKGIDYFEQAVKLDPDYAPAYAEIAESYVRLLYYGPLPSALVYPRAKAAAEKAVTLDASLAEGHTSMGEVRLSFEWNWPAAESEFKRAIQLNPGFANAHLRYGWFLDYMGRRREALAEMKRAQELDPLSLIINTNVGSALYYCGDYDLAIKQWQKTLELDPAFPPLRLWLGNGYLAKGLHKDGLRELEIAASLYNGNPAMLPDLVRGYVQSGKPAEARRILTTMQRKARERYVPPFNIAVAYAGIGEKDQAIKYLQTAYQDRDWGMLFLNLESKGWFASLRSDPRFQSILRRMNFPPQNDNTRPKP